MGEPYRLKAESSKFKVPGLKFKRTAKLQLSDRALSMMGLARREVVAVVLELLLSFEL
jgi:hypothetical protein